jgi:hypothetical protein
MPFTKRMESRSGGNEGEMYPRRDELWVGEKYEGAVRHEPIEPENDRSERAESKSMLHTIASRAA